MVPLIQVLVTGGEAVESVCAHLQCTHTYTIYIRLHNLKKKRAFSISYNRSSSHCWTFIGSTIVLETISST